MWLKAWQNNSKIVVGKSEQSYRLLARYLGGKKKHSKNKENQAKPRKNTQAANKQKTPRKTSKNVAKTPEY